MDAHRPTARAPQHGWSRPGTRRDRRRLGLGRLELGRLSLQALALAAALQTLLPAAAGAQQELPLECRLGDGAWRACTLTIARAGEHWWLQVGSRRLEFRSDGRGSITLSTGAGPARSVVPAWQPDRALCWDGVCARGEFPLD